MSKARVIVQAKILTNPDQIETINHVRVPLKDSDERGGLFYAPLSRIHDVL